MILNIAGIDKEYKAGTKGDEILVTENVENPDYVTISLNDEFLNHDEFVAKELADGDKIEFVYFMGGGQSDDND